MRRCLALAIPALALAAIAGCTNDPAPAAPTGAAAPTATSATAPAAPATSATAPATTTAATAAPEKAGGGPRACANDKLATTVTLQPDGSGGTLRAMVTLTNTGTAACTVTGRLTVSLVNAADEVVDVPTRRVDQPGPAEAFTIKAGTSAFAGIKWTTCDKADETCGVGNTLRYAVQASTPAPAATLEGFPDPERSGITMKSLQVGTIQPSNQGVVAW